MKKTKTFLIAGVIAAVLSAGSAVAAPGHNGGHNAPQQHTVVHVQSAPRPGHNHVAHNGGHHHVPAHHHHHHSNCHRCTNTGDFVIATAILLSALI